MWFAAGRSKKRHTYSWCFKNEHDFKMQWGYNVNKQQINAEQTPESESQWSGKEKALSNSPAGENVILSWFLTYICPKQKQEVKKCMAYEGNKKKLETQCC